jgi:IclR family transcriptional regulator, acetate operon repressor
VARDGESRTEGGETARRALRLLEALAAAGPPRGLDELAETVGLTRSTAYRLLRVLQEESYVERAGAGGYRLGGRFAALAVAALPQLDVYAAARPVLTALARRSGETASLHRRAGDLGLLVLAAESEQHSVRRVAAIGEANPLSRGCSGLAILAGLPPAEQDGVLHRTVPEDERPALRTALDGIRERGYVLSHGANHPGVNGIARGLPGAAGTSVAVSGPAERWTPERMRELAPALVEATDALADLLAHAAVTL